MSVHSEQYSQSSTVTAIHSQQHTHSRESLLGACSAVFSGQERTACILLRRMWGCTVMQRPIPSMAQSRSCKEQKDSYNCVHIAGVSLHASEPYPHGQLAVDSLRVQKVVLHVRADGFHFVKILIPHKEGELHLAGLVEVHNHLGLGNARLVADDLLRQHLSPRATVLSPIFCRVSWSRRAHAVGDIVLNDLRVIGYTADLKYTEQALTESSVQPLNLVYP